MSKNIELDFSNVKKIKKFIQNNEAGVYTGVNLDGVETTVYLDKKHGLKVSVKQSNGWYAYRCYDIEGYLEEDGVEK